jgi:hypothetical protein
MTKSTWDEEKIRELIKLWPSDLSLREIGRRIGMSKNACTGKGFRLGLPARGQLTTEGQRRNLGTYVGDKKRIRDDKIKHAAISSEELRLMVEMARKPEAAKRKSEPCMWVISEAPRAVYCEEPSVPGKSMCAVHRAIAIRPPHELKSADVLAPRKQSYWNPWS